MKTILALLMLATPTLADHCRKQVVIQSTGQVIVPFAVPVATPVAVATPYAYQHSGARAASVDPDYAEFLAWKAAKASTVKAAAVPQTLVTQHCASCHTPGHPNAKQDAIDHLDMSKPLTAEQKLDSVKALLLGTMPKGKTIESQLRSDLVGELSGVKPEVSK